MRRRTLCGTKAARPRSPPPFRPCNSVPSHGTIVGRVCTPCPAQRKRESGCSRRERLPPRRHTHLRPRRTPLTVACGNFNVCSMILQYASCESTYEQDIGAQLALPPR